jgi:phage shock protein C
MKIKNEHNMPEQLNKCSTNKTGGKEMYKKLYKSRTTKTIAGVCGGLEEYFNIDVTIIRLIWVAITIATGVFPGVFAYVAAALIIPEEPADYNRESSGNPNPEYRIDKDE